MTIYFDNSMATRPSERCVAKMIPMLTTAWGNPMSPHKKGQEPFPSLQESYKALYKLLGAPDHDLVIFTSSATEAVNQVIFSTYFDTILESGRNQYVTARGSEAAPFMAVRRMEKMYCVGKVAEAVTAQAITEAITPRTALVSLSWADGLTGIIHSVAEIAKVCRERGILLHLDASQILGKLYFDLEEIGADFISLEGSLIHAPQGTGALYIRKGAPASPFIVGGLEQAGHRGGPFNVAGLIGLGQAALEALDARDLLSTETARLRDKLERLVKKLIPDVTIFGDTSHRLPHISAMGFSDITSEALLFLLNQKGLFACIGGGNLQQIGFVVNHPGAISFSLSRETTEDEVDRAALIIAEAVFKLRKANGT